MMSETEDAGRMACAPFIFVEGEKSCSILLTGDPMVEKCPVFEELEGWLGNGYDWASVARTVIAEELPQLEGAVSFDPEADMFAAYGPRDAVLRLAGVMQAVFRDDSRLRDLLSRSELD
jgi:hypothetical protein